MANFTTIRVPGQNSVVADVVDDTLDLVPGPGITITTNAGADVITIGATSTTGYTGSLGVTGFTGSQGAQGNIGYSGSMSQSYRTFRVPGQASLIADQLDDVIDIVAGPGINITTNASIDAITISATGGAGGTGYTGSAGISGNTGFSGSRGYAGSASNSYKTIRVPGQASLVADQHDDILDIVAGPGILITTNAAIDAITITATGGGGGGGLGFTGSAGAIGDTGFTGSAGANGAAGGLGYTGSVGLGSLGYTGSVGLGSLGYTGSVGPSGSLGYTGSAGSAASANTALIVACSDESTPLTAGNAKTTFRMPYAFTLTGVRASLTAAQASGNIFTVDLNQNGTSILSTKITIDNTDKSSVSAATPPVISTSALTDDAEITVDIDQVGNGTAAGLKVTLIGYLP